MRQTFGWVTCRASWISRLKRSVAWLLPSASGRTVLSAHPQLEVLGFVDLPHAAAGDEPDDAIAGGDQFVA